MNEDTNSAAMVSSSSVGLDFPFERQMVENTCVIPSTFDTIANSKRRWNPRKKRSRNDKDARTASSAGSHVSKPKKYSKKTDPSAPKITPPCCICGKHFSSKKALFGHMRCHPERQWRGMNPPLDSPQPLSVSAGCPVADLEAAMTEEDQVVADCLIMLANGPNAIDKTLEFDDAGPSCRFECSSCKKVFGSHQALGGHRASHKNVKGCFAMARSDEEAEDHFQNAALPDHCGHERTVNLGDKMSVSHRTVHKCSICMMVFSSGQALGGHKWCHWERVEENAATEGFANLDLNMPAPTEDDSSSSYSSGLTLDLRLGL